MTTKRYVHASVTCGDSIYSIGGWDGSQWNRAERYDIETDQWISISPINQARSSHASVSIGESIFVLGGWYGNSTLSGVEMYDTQSNKWMEITPLFGSCNLWQFHLCNWGI